MGLTVFAQRLKHLREEKGLKQNELAKAVGVTPNTISSYEKSDTEGNGKKPTLENAQSIADYLNVSLDWLCGREDEVTTDYINLTTDDYFKSLANVIFETSAVITESGIEINNSNIINFIKKIGNLVNVYRSGSIPDDLLGVCIDKVVSDYSDSFEVVGECVLSFSEAACALSNIALNYDFLLSSRSYTMRVFDGNDRVRDVNLHFSEKEALKLFNKNYTADKEEFLQNGKHNPPKE